MSSLRYEQCPKCAYRGGDSRRDNLVRYGDGSAHCFACGYHEAPPYRGPYSELDERITKYDPKVFPADFTRQVGPAGWKWLAQYGLPISYWKDFCGYSPKEGRLVFPIPRQAPVFSIGRLVEASEHPQGRKWYVWGNCHSHAELFPVAFSPLTVVVEDLISAHKTGQIYEAMPLFGTEVHPAHLYALRDGSKRPIALWLDWDQRGLTYKKANRLSLLTNRPVQVVHTHHDPKLLSLKEIENVLEQS